MGFRHRNSIRRSEDLGYNTKTRKTGERYQDGYYLGGRERERESMGKPAYGIYKDQLNSQQDKFDNKCKEEEEGSGYLGSYLTSLLLITGFGC